MNNTHNTFDIKIIKNLEELESIKSIWYELTKDNYNIHVTYEWMTCWLKCFLDKKSSLYLIIVYKDNKPIAIAPLLIKKDKFLLIPYKKVEFISMVDYPDSPTNICAELDFIITQLHKEVIETIIKELIKERWNFIRLHPIEPNSPTINELKNASMKYSLIYINKEAFKSLVVHTGSDWQSYQKSLSRGFKKELIRHKNKLSTYGKLEYVLFKTEEEIKDNFKYVLDIEQRSWKWNKGISINSVKYNNFFQEFPKYVGHHNWVHLWLLKLNNEYIAYDIILCYKNKVICWKGSYDTKYSDFGPGQILFSHSAEYYIKMGIGEFNMLWGETIAKQRWKPVYKPYIEVYIFRKDIYSTILKILLLDLNFYLIRRIIRDYKNRLLRKLRIRTRKSELTRMDQLKK